LVKDSPSSSSSPSLREAHHTILFVEHYSSLYEDSMSFFLEVAGALAEAARTALVVLYAPRQDPTLKILSRRADRIFCLEVGDWGSQANRGLPPAGDQTTLEAFGWGAKSGAVT
jgi:hypothetical protein